MSWRRFGLILVTAASLGLAGCGATKPNTGEDFYDSRGNWPKGSLTGSDTPLLSIGKNRGERDDGSALGVNAYLWRGALDTLSFMPLASADPFGGVIITDWFQPAGANGERFKATAYILGRQLRTDGVRVSVFRQELRAGQWVDAAINSATGGELENRILARARDLRSQSAGL